MENSDAKNRMIQAYFKEFPADAANILASFPVERTVEYLNDQPAEIAATILSTMNPDQGSEILEALDPVIFKNLIIEMDAFLAARLISRFDQRSIQRSLEELPSGKSKQIKELLSYPPGCAAYVMDSRVTTFKQETTVGEAIERLRILKNRKLYQVYLVDDEGRLTHTVPVQAIAVSESMEKLSELADGPPVYINALAPREEVVSLLETWKLINLPVVDIHNHLLGVIRNDALMDAAKTDVAQDVQALFGAGREERALSKVSLAVRQRLPWLQINLATAFLAASVVAIFEETISRITVLAVFLPVVAGQSGNTGSQALAVTMRGLALREIGISQWFVVARKEILVGIINGVAVALTTSVIVFIWASSFGLALVIGISMIISMAIAGLSGALIPMILQSLGQDPASSSSIILTTVTDIVGFLSFLGLATALATVLGIV
jgi:magnesium transporter